MGNKSSGKYNIIDDTGIKRSINNVISSNINFNTYSSPKGLRELRIEIGKFLEEYWDYKIDYNKILITTGSQQSINLLVNSLLQEGDTVLIEEPTYFGAIDCLKKRSVNLIGVELKVYGLDLKDLEDKIVYEIDENSYPTLRKY
jgi:DNA-binding transcriptional MocR family regulator